MLTNQQVYLDRLNFVRWIPKGQTKQLLNDETQMQLSGLKSMESIVENCEKCSLHKTRQKTVFGGGKAPADFMFVGEAPGSEEDRRGVPFIGRAGQLLDAMIFSIGIDRNEVYIANVLKCRPPDNRDPLGIEVQSCEGYLHRQIELVKPKLIIALGRFAAQSLLKSSLPIGKLRGQLHCFVPFQIPLIATYHPAYLLRSPLEKRKVWEDLVLAKSVLSSE